MRTPPFRSPVPTPLHHFGWDRPPSSTQFRVTQRFNDTNPKYPTVRHLALDLGNGHLGADIYAAGDGTVIAEGYVKAPWSEPTDLYGTGNFGGIMVVIDHGNGWITGYAHLAESIVNKGQNVKRGQKIGVLGATGSANPKYGGGGGHLHWDVYRHANTSMTVAQARSHLVNGWPLLEQNYNKIISDLKAAIDEADKFHVSKSRDAVKSALARLTHIHKVIS